ncbi:MAG: hypothetical protein CSA22_02530 [Deltaproteobacteria bacterium]|nr:MAG: hypothetical protein CSA22_02530 [Deltaproteobacteria bacterium]
MKLRPNDRCPARMSLILVMFMMVTGSTWAATPVNVTQGQSKTLSVGFTIAKVATGDPSVCGVLKTADRELLVNAKQAGRTNVIVWGADGSTREYAITVTGSGLTITAGELKSLLSTVEGVSVRLVGSRVLVEGEVFTKKDLERVRRVTQGLSNVINMVELSPLMKTIVKDEIEGVLKDEGFSNLRLKFGKNNFILTGQVGSQAEMERALKLAGAYAADIVNAIEVDDRIVETKAELIEMSLQVMEIETSALKNMGIHWNPGGSLGGSGSYSGQSGSKPSLSGSLTGTISSLFPKMKRIQDTGAGRSLMEQSLITQSGGTADFFAGSEVPIPVAQDGGNMSVEYKKVGVTLEFSPVIDPFGRVTSPIKIEASSVSGEGPGGAPVISTSKLNTIVGLENGESVALAGLVGQKEMRLLSKSPPGGGSALFQANKETLKSADTREVVIFVTPRILSRAGDGVDRIQRRVKEGFKAQDRQE